MDIEKPRKGTLLSASGRMVCPPCFDGMHGSCDWGKCDCLCHSAYKAKPEPRQPVDTLALPLSGVSWERERRD